MEGTGELPAGVTGVAAEHINSSDVREYLAEAFRVVEASERRVQSTGCSGKETAEDE